MLPVSDCPDTDPKLSIFYQKASQILQQDENYHYTIVRHPSWLTGASSFKINLLYLVSIYY